MAAKSSSDSKSAASSAASGSDFKFPEFYHFPPFFTLQPVSTTRSKQVAVWRDFILQYITHYRLTALILSEEQKKPLFFNAKIDRKLPLDVAQMLVADLINQGRTISLPLCLCSAHRLIGSAMIVVWYTDGTWCGGVMWCGAWCGVWRVACGVWR